MHPHLPHAPLLLALALGSPALAQQSTLIDFEDGTARGFEGYAVDVAGGNPGRTARLHGPSTFATFQTGRVPQATNPDVLGDYSQFGSVTFSLDIKVDRIDDLVTGQPQERTFGLWLTDRDVFGNAGPSAVYVELARISSALQADWTTLSVTIDDTASATLPPGWTGSGELNLDFTNPRLPAGATFATVLASVDQIDFTCAVPGEFGSAQLFDVRIDNVRVALDGEIGTPYCSANANSTGAVGVTRAIGSSAVVDDDVTLEATSLPPNAFGIFVVGSQPANQPLQSGVLCVGGTLGRYQAPGQIFMADASGHAALAIDLAAIPQAGASVSASVGDSWHFQAWHRDTLPGGAATANLALPTRVALR